MFLPFLFLASGQGGLSDFGWYVLVPSVLLPRFAKNNVRVRFVYSRSTAAVTAAVPAAVPAPPGLRELLVPFVY